MTIQTENDALPAYPAALQELRSQETGPTLFSGGIDLIRGLRIRLSVSVGAAEVSVGELFALREGSVVKLDRMTDAPLDITLDGKVIARGSLVVVGDNFGIRIDEILAAPQP